MLRLIQRSSSRRCRCPIRLSSPSFKTASLSLVTRSSGNDSSATSFYGVDPELAASAKNYSYVSGRAPPFPRTGATDPIKKIAIQVNQLSYDMSFLRELDSFGGHKLACAALLRALSDLNHKQIRELNESRDFVSHNAVLHGDNFATTQRIDKNQEEFLFKEGNLLLTGGELDRQQHQEQHRQQPLQQRTVADTQPLHPEDNGETEQNRLHREIEIALGNKHVKPKTLIALFDKAKSTNNLNAIDNIQLSKMVFFLSRKNTRYALKVLKLLESSLAEKNGKLVSVILYRYIRNGLLKAGSPELIDELINHIKETYPEGSKRVIYQQIILPEIAMELLKHKNSTMKACATSIMNYVLEKRFPVDLNSDVYEAFLERAELGKCGRDSPFHRLFAELVTNGYRPDPSRVMKLLMGYYPYTDTQPIQEILTSIHELQSETPQSALTDYKLDMGTLEAISTAAVQEKNIDLNLLIWDLLDLYQYKPTECLFENVILSFALRKRDENAFAALMDMERSGFTPSRALLRRLAVKVSYKSHGRMVNARNLIYDAADLMGTPSMNVLILGLGMRRDIQAAMEVYDHMILNGLVADGNTFDFLIEALYIDAKDIFTPSKENPRPEDEDYVISGMGMIEKSMEEAGIEPSTHFYHEKIRLLCTIGRPEESKIVLDEAIEKGTRIGVGSIVFLTYRLASNGYFEAANQVVELCSVAGCGDPPEYLVMQLKNREEKWRRRRRPEINHDDDDDSE